MWVEMEEFTILTWQIGTLRYVGCVSKHNKGRLEEDRIEVSQVLIELLVCRSQILLRSYGCFSKSSHMNRL